MLGIREELDVGNKRRVRCRGKETSEIGFVIYSLEIFESSLTFIESLYFLKK